MSLAEIGRQWIENAPPAKPGAAGLLGFSGEVGFVCAACASRIIGRGCALTRLASNPVWESQSNLVCALCEK